MTPPIRLLVVDDHPVLRDGFVAVLSTQSDFQVVGEAEGGVEAVQTAAELRPDVIFLDLCQLRLLPESRKYSPCCPKACKTKRLGLAWE